MKRKYENRKERQQKKFSVKGIKSLKKENKVNEGN